MRACQARRMGSYRAYRAPAALLLTVVLWGSAFPAIQVGVTGYGWAGLALLRLAIASAALAVVCALAGIRRPAPRDLPLILVSAATGMAGYQLLLNWGELRVSGGTASLIVVTNPIYSAVIATAFLGERIARRQVIGGAIALAGVAAITLGQGGLHLERPALAVLAAAVALGTYHGAIKPLLGRYTGLEVTAYATWAGTAMLLPAIPALAHAWPQAGPRATAAAVFLGLAPSALGFVAWGYGVARLPVTVATASLYLVPPIAILVGYVWLGDKPTAIELIGGGIAIGGVVVASRRPGKAAAREDRSAEPVAGPSQNTRV
jgi:drug/metabolite transporter (DMT)-like permease